MNISGIRPSEGFYSYNSIRVNELRNSQIMSSKQAVDDTASQQSIADDTADYEDARARQSFTSLDYANTYDSNASYELKGADSDISTLDVAKAVSDLDKDKVLQQYQGRYHQAVGKPSVCFALRRCRRLSSVRQSPWP